jgi:hypothetical protein
MKISKLLSFILGLSGFMRMGIVDGDGGGMSMHDAGAALAGIESGPSEDSEEDTEESAAERLAAEDAKGATASEDNSGEQKSDKVDPSEIVTIEVDGKMVQMTKAEIAEAKKGEMRQSDYTQKTMAAAEATKAAHAERQAAAAEREKLANQLHTYTMQTQAALSNIEAQMTDELLQSDPVHYLTLERTLRKGQADLVKANSDLGELQKQHQAEQAEQHRAYQQSQQQALLAKLPEWKDGAKAKEEAGKIQQYLTSQEFSAQDIGQLEDHRFIVMARKAMMYDGLMERVGKATKTVAAAPVKVERPGVAQVAPTDGRTQGMKKLTQTGSVRDAGALIAGLI